MYEANEINTTAKPMDLLRESIVNIRNDVIKGLETYSKSGYQKHHFEYIVKPKIQSLYLLIKPEFEKSYEEDYMLIFRGNDADAIMDLYYKIDSWLMVFRVISLTTERKR